jgi:NAD(P)-dependent dehydrogenase (short-subunit alcohol dehydrogenase family)
MRPIEQQVILVTGATDGLGQGVALDLARRGATVLVHGRDPARIAHTLDAIGGASTAREYRADFASLDDVRKLAADVLRGERRLDALVNNAGIGTRVPGDGHRMESRDGYELRFAVNYLAHYLLTDLLLPLLKSSAPSRIVNVSSVGQQALDFDDLMLTRGYSGTRAYCQSKLAQILFTKTLAEKLEGTGVTINALHPATFMPTKIVATPTSTLEEGVEATVRLVIDESLEGVSGRYYDGLEESRPNAQAADPAARRKLWERSRELVGLSPRS